MVSRTKLAVVMGSVMLLTALLALGLANVSAQSGVDLHIDKWSSPAAPGPVIAGEELFYHIQVWNGGTMTATNVLVTDTLPYGVSYIDDTDDCVYWPGINGFDQLICHLGQLDPGQGRNFDVKLRVEPFAVVNQPDNTIVLNNSAEVGSNEEDDDPGNNTAIHSIFVEGSADLTVTKMSKPDTHVRAGDFFTYTIYVENLGPSVAQFLGMRDELLSSGAFEIADYWTDRDDYGAVCLLESTEPGISNTLLCMNLLLEPKGFMIPPAGEEYFFDTGRWTITVVVRANETQDLNDVAQVFPLDQSYPFGGEVYIGTPDPNWSNNTAQDFIYVTDVADLSITKELGRCDGPDGMCVAGGLAQFNVTVWNDGPSTAENVVVEDLLPAGVTVVEALVTEGSGYCTTGIPGDPFAPLTCNLGPLVDGDGNVISILVRIDPDYVDAELPSDHRLLENDAWTYSDIFDPDNTYNRDHVILQVGTWSDVSMWKSGPEFATAGEEIIYNIGVWNHGPSTLQGFLFYDNLPPEVTYLGYEFGPGTGSCIYPWSGQHVVLCYLDDMPPGAESHVQLRVAIKPETTPGIVIHNWIGGYFCDSMALVPEPLPERDTEVTAVADLSIEKTSEPMKIYPGEQKVYHIEVTNNGPTIAPEVTVTDTLPMSLTYEIDNDNCDLVTQDPDVLECRLGNMMPGETKAFDVWALVSRDAPPGEITNEAHVFMGGEVPYEDPDPGNDWAYATNLVLEPTVADLSIEKSWGEAPANWFEFAPFGPDDCYRYYTSTTELTPTLGGVVAGCPLTFSLTVNNTGPLLAENVVVEDVMPAGVTVEGVGPSQGSCTTGLPGDPAAPLTCNLGNIPRDEGAGITVFARADADLAWEPLENDAVVSSDIPDPDNGNNRSHVLIWVEPFSYLGVNKEGPADPPEITAGEQIEYWINLWNEGPSTAHEVYLNDELPGGVSLLDAEVMVGDGSCEPDSALCSLGDMQPGANRGIRVRGYVDPWLDGVVITNTVHAWAHTSPFTFTIPITPSVETLVHSAADLSIRKTGDPYKVFAGEQKRYDIEVTNNGPSVAHNVLVTDTLPPGVEYEIDTDSCQIIYSEVMTPTMLGSTQPGEGGGALFSTDLVSGTGTFIGYMPDYLAPEIEYDNGSNRLFASMGFAPWYWEAGYPRLYELDPNSGASLGYVQLDEQCALPGLEFVGDTLYGTCSYYQGAGPDLVTIDQDTGDMGYVGDTDLDDMVHGLAYEESSATMYGLTVGYTNTLVTINLSTGVATQQCVISDTNYYHTAHDLRSIEFGPDGTLYGGLTWDSDLVRIDTSPYYADDEWWCDMTHIGDTGFSITGLTLAELREPVGVECSLDDIPPGETATFSIWARVKPDTLGMINNRVDVISETYDPILDNNWDSEANLVLGKADLKVTKFGKPDGEVRAGEELEYWVIVDNLGPGFAHDVVLRDFIATDGEFDLWWGEEDGDGDGEEYTCQATGCEDCYDDYCEDCYEDALLTCRLNDPLPVMSPDDAGRWLLKVWVEAQEEQSINNLARVVSSDFDPDLSNNEAIAEHEITAVADLELDKEAWGEVLVGCYGETYPWENEVAAGGILEYTLYIENEGPSEAENVVVEDWGLSPFLDIEDVDCEKDDWWRQCSCNLSGLGELGDTDRHFVCYMGTIEEDDEDHITITARIPSDVPEGTRLVNDARVYSDVFDDDNGDNLDYNWTYVIANADLAVEKSQEPETTLPGLEVVYTIRVDNLGPSDAHGVLISDTLPFTPTTMSVEGCASDGGRCDVPCEVPTCPAGECPWPDVDFVAQADIPAGEWVIYTLTAVPEWVPCEMITNTVQVVAEYDYEHDIDPCDENDFAYTESDPECNFVPLVLKSYPGPDSPP